MIHGDRRIPTFEVAIFDADENMIDLLNYQNISEVEIIFTKVASMEYTSPSDEQIDTLG